MKTKDNKNGLILVAVLWIVVILTVIAASINFNSRLNKKISFSAVDAVKCKWTARAGIETAMAVLNEDSRDSDSFIDLWNDNEEDFNDIVIGDSSFMVKVLDETGKLNINTATKEQLMVLPRMTEDVADAIIDWRDSDDSPGISGAEVGYYENLPFRYKIRNGPFKTIRELLMVKGVTEDLLYGEDTNLNGRLDLNERDGSKSPPNDNGDDTLDKGWIEYLTCYSYGMNTDAQGNQRININQADEGTLTQSLGLSQSQARGIVNNRPNNQYRSAADLVSNNSPRQSTAQPSSDSQSSQPMDLATFSGIADRITTSNQQKISGMVNVNTASNVVLAALLGGDDKAYQLAENIINYRDTLADGITGIADLLNVQSMDVSTLQRIAGSITTRSSAFLIRSIATSYRPGAGMVTVQTEAVVDRSSDSVRILYWYEGETN